MDNKSKTVIITGGNTGLVYQCARNIAIHDKSYHIIIASRNLEKSKKAIEELKKDTGNSNIHCMELDLASLSSIRSFYEKYSASVFPPLYALVCNAALGADKEINYTKDGFERTFGTNHLGHFLLANLLLKNITGDGRIVFVSSDTHAFSSVQYTDALHLAYPEKYEGGKIDGFSRYATSKLCNIYCTYEMADKIASETKSAITVNAFNPGYMPNTELNFNLNKIKTLQVKLMVLVKRRSNALEKSSAALASLVTDAKYNSVTGKYIDQGKIIKSSPLSYNKANAKNLWDKSVELVNLTDSETIFK